MPQQSCTQSHVLKDLVPYRNGYVCEACNGFFTAVQDVQEPGPAQLLKQHLNRAEGLVIRLKQLLAQAERMVAYLKSRLAEEDR